MATRLEQQPLDTATADFKLWTGFIHNLILTTCGWTQTTDTGQTNPTTVSTAPANNTYIYEVFKASDSLATSSPLFVKMEYGQQNSDPAIAVTIGTGSNGAGVISGGGHRFVMIQNNGHSATLGSTGYDCIGSGDASGFRFILWRNHPSTLVQVVCAVERARDSSGNYIGDYATAYFYAWQPEVLNATASPFWRQQSVLSTGGAGNEEPCLLSFHTALASGGLNSNVAAVPAFPMPGYLGNPSMDLLVGKGGDFTEAGTVSIQIYGAAHTYYFSKVGNLSQSGAIAASQLGANNFVPVTNNGLLMRYE